MLDIHSAIPNILEAQYQFFYCEIINSVRMKISCNSFVSFGCMPKHKGDSFLTAWNTGWFLHSNLMRFFNHRISHQHHHVMKITLNVKMNSTQY